ncbi:MAG: DNA polymerase I [candidate division Zixibacteria bacterium RBG_16_40_9]|nr:MAG: DNA polymerase I [candidate division Zixibacteria bacterium RBG_16_40_9]
MTKKKRLFLIDGSALAYRSYFAFIRNPLINSKGVNTSAVFGFTNSLLKILKEEKPDYLAIVFDTAAPTFRHEIYKDYKSTRSKMPEDMSLQLPLVYEVIEAMQLPVLEMEGFEADDLMGTLAKKSKMKGIKTVLVTGDKDFLQLVDEDIVVLNPRRAGEEMELLDEKKVKEKWRVPPDRVTDVLALMGDTSDNVPGVPGIGEKTAVELVEKFKSLENLLENLAKVEKKKLKENIEFNADQARLSKRLVTIDTNVPCELDLEKFKIKDYITPRVKEIFKELEFTSLLEQVSEKKLEQTVKYRTVESLDELTDLISELKKAGGFAIDTETSTISAVGTNLVGISISKAKGEAYYIPVGHRGLESKQNLDLKKTLSILKPILEDEKFKKIGQNAKFDILVFKQIGIEVKGISFDPMIASYLLNPSIRQHNLDNLALKYLDHKMIPIEDLIGSGKKQKSFAEVPIDKATVYSCEDADFTFRLKEILHPQLKELELERLFYEVEIPLIDVLAEMELAGVSVDLKILKEVSRYLEKEIDRYTKEIFEMAGQKFNLNSPQQLAKVLFEDLKLKPIRRTTKKTHQSTDIQVLEELAKLHPLPKALLEYRQLAKLKSTYVDALPELINKKTGRIHTSFNQTVAATGRLSSSDPNLQNIPIRTEIGQKIRKAFVPGSKEFLLMSVDYSQIELRILAHFSEDPTMINSFLNDEDIHTRTASEVFGVSPEDVTSEQRRQAKIANFAVIYGVSAYGLSQQTDMTVEEADMFIKIYFKRYPKVAEYIDNIIEKAKKDGFVTTMLGRRRYIPEINSENRQAREFAERIALNTPIQGTAADLIKIVMIRIFEEMKSRACRSKMILQVHDELVFEVYKSELEWLKKMVKDKMENSLKLKVPIKVEIGVGENWLELEY